MLTQNRVTPNRTERFNWTVLTFGKHQGKTLPAVLFDDPDWFFWAVEEDFLYGRVRSEAAILFYRARNIKIPGNPDAQLEAEYQFDPFARKFSGLRIVSSSKSIEASGANVRRSDRIDMRMPYELGYYDKKGYRLLVKTCEKYLLDYQDLRPLRDKCGQFFADPGNFL